MLISEELKQTIDIDFIEVIKQVEYKKEEIMNGLDKCNELEKMCMKFLYTCMPLSDMANYSFDTYLSFAKHALFLREKMSWTKEIPVDIFLNYVLFYRVNNENIEVCREIFYEKLHKRIENKSLLEAIIEVNYWSLEEVTYKATDERTASPLAVLKSACGRCGEESTFTVTALRSVGIPARQVYVPRWSHCDDNHAWVEVWCNGQWRCLGACEPEEILDTGWFMSPAARAMMIHSRVFSSFNNCTKIISEEITLKSDKATLINNLGKYANTRPLTVKVINENNNPIKDVIVRFEVLNYSEFFPVATVQTDAEGIAKVTLGLGDIHIHAVKDGRFLNKIVNVENESCVELHWEEAITSEIITEQFDIVPPRDDLEDMTCITEEQKQAGKERFIKSDNKRKQKESYFYNEDKVKLIINKYNSKDDVVINSLIKSKGNYQEVENFLNDTNSRNNNGFIDKLNILKSLVDKDYRDITCEQLLLHLQYSVAYKGKYPEEIFIKYVKNPRIYYEMITNYRKFILEYFDITMQESFKNHPKEIWKYINTNIIEMPKEEYSGLYTNPVELLKIKKGSYMSKKILFVAICRTLGIAARINKEDLEIQYYNKGQFINIDEQKEIKTSKLIIKSEINNDWVYMLNWSIAKLEDGIFRTLDYTGENWKDNKIILDLEEGNYRIITTNRMPDGSCFCNKYAFVLLTSENKTINISVCQGKIDDMFKNIEINDFKLCNEYEEDVMAKDIIKKDKNMIVWIEEGKEPTEHILNEMIEHQDIFNKIDCDIIFVLRSEGALQNATLSQTIKIIPNIRLYYENPETNVSSIARSVYVEPDKLPLILVTNKKLNVVHAFSGYNVGLSELVVKIVKAM